MSMHAKVEKFESGWIGVSLALSSEDIDLLIHGLQELKSRDIDHFHFRNDDFSSDIGIADIEITRMGKEEKSNLTIE